MPRTATIGPAVYERVNELVGEGKTRTEAFAAVASERSMNPGTVAANYYRTARSQGGTSTRRRRTRQTNDVVLAAPTRRGRARRTSPGTTTMRGRARRASASTTTNRPQAADVDLNTLANQISDVVHQLVRQVEERDRQLRAVLG